MLLIREPRRTTLQLYYYMPDHPSLLQEFMWQTLDVPPTFPRIHRFLAYWRREVEAVIHSVNVCAGGIERPFSLKVAAFDQRI